MNKGGILVVDDEKDITEILEYSLSNHGYQVWTASDGREAIKKAEKHHPEIIILDIMMPEVDGIEVCRKLRSNPDFENTLIIILSARGEEYSEVAGFDAGADDYVVKPVKIRSLVKRLDAIMRRKEDPIDEILEFQGLTINKARYNILMDEEEIKLPRKEFELLYALASKPNRVITRDEILEKIWGKKVIVGDRTIDVHVRRIRKKIGDEYIKTVKGVGYKFSDAFDQPAA